MEIVVSVGPGKIQTQVRILHVHKHPALLLIAFSSRRPAPRFEISLEVQRDLSDESSCADRAPKDEKTMTTSETSRATEAAAAAEQGAKVAPQPSTSKKAGTRKIDAPKASRGGKAATSRKQPTTAMRRQAKREHAKTGAVVRAHSKKTVVVDLLCREAGATLGEIAKVTGWQNHSIRGFISGTVGKKMGLAVDSTKSDGGERTYKISVK